MNDFAQEIIKLTGASQKIVYHPLPQDDPKQRQPDIAKAKALLNWEPQISRREGLKITYDYFSNFTKEQLEATKNNKEFLSVL
jgi:dTDP-glucose 4,6-dehydratase